MNMRKRYPLLWAAPSRSSALLHKKSGRALWYSRAVEYYSATKRTSSQCPDNALGGMEEARRRLHTA